MKFLILLLPLFLLQGCQESMIMPFANAGEVVNADFILPKAENDRLNLKFNVKVEYRLSKTSPWNQVLENDFDGIGAIQYHLNSDREYRMIMEIEKPFNVKGTFKARSNNRSGGVSLPDETRFGKIIFGPHIGCQEDLGNLCDPLDIGDVGLVELRLDGELQIKTSFGDFLVRAFTNRPEPIVRPSIVFNEELIPCGSSIKKKGFWIFAKRIRSDGSFSDTISLCVEKPDGETKCAKFNDFDLKVKPKKKGKYKFVVWNELFLKSTCTITVR